MCVRGDSESDARAEPPEYLGESVSNFDMTTFARSRYRGSAESGGSRRDCELWL